MKDSVSPYQPRQYIRDIIEGQLVSITGGLLAGFILASHVGRFDLFPGFFILFPGFLEFQGSLNGTLAARIGSRIHRNGLKSVDELTDLYVKENLLATIALSLTGSFLLGIFAFLLSFLILKKTVFELIFICLFASILAGLILIPTTLIFTILLYKKRHDPDNIMGPLVTTLSDIASVISLILAIVFLIK